MVARPRRRMKGRHRGLPLQEEDNMTGKQIDALLDQFIDTFIDRPFKYVAALAILSGLAMMIRAWLWILTEGPN